MMRLAIIIGLLLKSSSLQAIVPVPDDVHSDVKGPSTICGVTAKNALAFQLAVRDSGPYALLSKNDDYFAVISDDHMTIWAFTMPSTDLPPAAVCTRLVKDSEGNISGEFDMRCEGERKACDAVFKEWLAYHQKNTLKRVTATPREG